MITKTAMITICGRPNVGKSTLTNALVGEKIAIVSNKPQTTRNRISAVVNRGDTQLILMDTPGFHKPRNRLGDYMVQVVRESVADVDGVMLVVEPIASIGEQEHALIERIRTSNAPAVLVINKIDKPGARVAEVEDEVLELFMELDATDEQLDFPVVYANGRDGIAKYSMDDDSDNLEPLFKTIIKYCPCPKGDAEGPLQFMVTTLDYDDYVGKIAIGRIVRGKMYPGCRRH